MRVISGSQKGRQLKAVPGKNTRPTTDKVKESVFNIIGPYFDGGLGLDLFAGSGGLGIEGISRGLDKVLFIDSDYKAIRTIKENIKLCGFEAKAEIYKNDWKRALELIIERQLKFEVIWMDPPYKKDVYTTILTKISNHQLLDNTGIIVCEHAKENILPDQIESLVKTRTVHYGTISISLYQYTD